MNKTILKLDFELSVILLSLTTMFFSFLTSYSYINSFTSFIYIFIKSVVFIVVPLILYILEKENLQFKRIAGIYTSYFIISMIVTILTSISIINGNISIIFKGLFDFANLVILLTSLFILIEQVLAYANIKSKLYNKIIMNVVYLIGNFISYPFLVYIDKKSNKKDKE